MGSEAAMYWVKEGKVYVLRQAMYKPLLAQGREHPHDTCAYARTVEETHRMADDLWSNVDYSAIETQA